MNYGGLFQTGNENAGGWRFGFENRPTSNSALQAINTIDPEFLKKVAQVAPEKKGLLDSALTATPLTGLLDTGGGIGNEGTQPAQQNGGWTTDANGNRVQQVSGTGLTFGSIDPMKSGLGLLTAGLPGLLTGVKMQQLAPVFDAAPPGIADYGRSMNANGPTTEAQAKALADQLAAQLALGGYGGGGGGGYGGLGGITGGSDTMGFGGEY